MFLQYLASYAERILAPGIRHISSLPLVSHLQMISLDQSYRPILDSSAYVYKLRSCNKLCHSGSILRHRYPGSSQAGEGFLKTIAFDSDKIIRTGVQLKII